MGAREKRRDELVREHHEWAHREGRFVLRAHPRTAPPDLDGIVNEALLEAAANYDTSKGRFRNYARLIIRGRIKDAQRGADLMSRDERVKERREKTGRVKRHTPLPVDSWGQNEEAPRESDRRSIAAAPTQDDHVLGKELLAMVSTLPHPLGLVVQEKLRGRLLHEIGEDLGLSEARISQLLSEALYILHLELDGR